MIRSSARSQAIAALALAAALAGAWALFGTGLRVRWLVAKGAPPAKGAEAEAAAEAIRARGEGARAVLASILEDPGTSRARKSWVASLLLRSPFFAQAEVERALASPVKSTARAAAFALMDGESTAAGFEEAAAVAETGSGRPRPRAPREAWDPAPAIPVLADWLGDRGDRDSRYAARLLGRIPPGDPRVKEALLRCVEEVPELAAPGAPPALAARKMVVVDCLQSLLAWAREHEDVPVRVSRVVAWIEKEDRSEGHWDLEAYALRLVEIARGRGVDPALFDALARSRNPVVRQKLAGTLEAIPWHGTSAVLEALLGDEVPQVRRASVLALKKRRDPLLLDLAPWIAEDSMIYVRSDALGALGELVGVDPERCRRVVPLLVDALEDPWPGPAVDAASPLAPYFTAARAEVIESCAVSLYRITHRAPGFGEDGMNDWKKRSENARRLEADPAARKAVVEEWRKSVPARPAKERIPHLVRRLEDRDPDNVVRAARELHRLTSDTTGFPPEVLAKGPDDTAARNAVRASRGKGEWAKVVEYWKARKAE